MTKWQTRRELVTKNLPMWRVFRIVDGVEEVDIRLYDTWDDAAKAAWELNAKMEEAEKEKAPIAAVTAQGAEK